MKKQSPSKGLFYKLARQTSEAVGSPIASISAVTVIVIWAITGPIFKFKVSGSFVVGSLLGLVASLIGAAAGCRPPRTMVADRDLVQ